MSDRFWSAIEALLPPKSREEGRAFQRRPGAGRKPIPARKAFEAVVHVLRTGTPWKALPKSLGSASAIHRRFDAWQAAGLFLSIWKSGLAEHEEMEGISWQWHCEKPEGSESTVRPRLWQPSRARRRRKRGCAC